MAGYSKVTGIICLLLFLPLVGSGRKSDPAQTPSQTRLRPYLVRGSKLFESGKYTAAIEVFRSGASDAERSGDRRLSARFLNGLGACYVRTFQYPLALDAFLRCRRMAEQAGDLETYGGASSNISALYLQNNDVDSAAAVMEQALPHLNRLSGLQNRARLLLQLGTVRMEQGRNAEARQWLRQGIELADRAGDERAAAYGFERIGITCLREKNWAEAENNLIEAYRLRRLHKLWELGHSCRLLATLRIAQKDWTGAAVLLDRAVEFVRSEPAFSWPWLTYHLRGRVREAQGRLEEALEDYRTALDLSRRFRLDVLPADFTRVLTDVRLDDIYSSFVEAASAMALSRKRPDLAGQAFAAAEENRAASLRALLADPGDWREKLPPGYWQTLAQTHRAEVAALQHDSPQTRAQLERMRAELVEMEFRAGVNRLEETEGLVAKTQRTLDGRTALLAFHLGRAGSQLWAVTSRDFELHPLPAGAVIASRIREFVSLVRTDSPRAVEAGRDLYALLFSRLGPAVTRKQRWLLALEEPLFDIPFGALVVSQPAGGPVFLVQERAIEIVPGALWLRAPAAGAGPAGGFDGPFLGVGDAIYNSADPRWNKAGTPANLPRLAASAREIQACSQAWGAPAPPILLTGPAATKTAVRKALEARPSIVHFAAHVVQAESHPQSPPGPGDRADPLAADEQTRMALRQSGRHALIELVLSPSADSGGEYLGPDEIKNWRVPSSLVAINACSSAGKALRGAGLMGLTRPWLAAGATAVAATRWPVPDDAALFLSLYRHLRDSPIPDPAAALRSAQLDMLRAGDWRSRPGFWASYFVVGSY